MQTVRLSNPGDPVIDSVVMLAAVQWGYIAQTQQHFAQRFAEMGIRVVFVEPFPHRIPHLSELHGVLQWTKRAFRGSRYGSTGLHRTKHGVYVVTPTTLPEINRSFIQFNRRLLIPRIARRIVRLCKPNSVVQVWKPLDGHWAIAQQLKPTLLVYSCVDNYSAQYDAPAHYADVEAKLCHQADLVMATSHYLKQHVEQWSENVHLRDRAVDFGLFSQAATPRPTSYRRLCYFGAISERLDFSIIQALAGNGYEVMLLGPIKRCPFDPATPPKNIRFHPEVPYDQVPKIIRDSDCLIIPYCQNEATKAIMPLKIYECLATGKPLVVTPMSLGDALANMIYVADSAKGFLMALRKLENIETNERYAARCALAKEKTWESLVQTEIDLMRAAISSNPVGDALD